jgi:hypothetical protein
MSNLKNLTDDDLSDGSSYPEPDWWSDGDDGME